MNCNKCGSVIPEGMTNCPKCEQINSNIPNANIPVFPEENEESLKEKNIMKVNKKVYALVILGVLFILILSFYFVFSSKRLECTITINDGDLKLNTQVNLKFHSDKLSTFRMTSTAEFSGESLDYLDDIVDKYKKKFNQESDKYEDTGIKYTFSKTSNGFQIEYTGNNNNFLKTSNNLNKSLEYNDLKSEYEQDGYTCK